MGLFVFLGQWFSVMIVYKRGDGLYED